MKRFLSLLVLLTGALGIGAATLPTNPTLPASHTLTLDTNGVIIKPETFWPSNGVTVFMTNFFNATNAADARQRLGLVQLNPDGSVATNGIITVDNIAALRNVICTNGIGVVLIRGNEEPGDGGGGFFSYNPAIGRPADNNGTDVHPNNFPGNWHREIDLSTGEVAVRFFGPSGTNQIIQLAFDYLAAHGGGGIRFPNGVTYISIGEDGIGLAPPDNVSIIGNEGATLALDHAPDTSYTMLSLAGRSNIVVGNLTIVGWTADAPGGDNDNYGYGIEIAGSTNITLSHLSINSMWSNGVHMAKSGDYFNQGIVLEHLAFGDISGTNVLVDADAFDTDQGFYQTGAGNEINYPASAARMFFGTTQVLPVTAVTPGGSTGDVQFKSGSTFAGDSAFNWNNSTKALALSTVTTFRPSIADLSAPFVFDTTITHTSGHLWELKNHGTLRVAITADGSFEFTPSTTQVSFRTQSNGDSMGFYTALGDTWMILSPNGNMLMGAGTTNTSKTSGMMMIPSTDGAATGTPSDTDSSFAYSALNYDFRNGQLQIYNQLDTAWHYIGKAGGSNKSVLFNDSTAIGGDSFLQYDKTTHELSTRLDGAASLTTQFRLKNLNTATGAAGSYMTYNVADTSGNELEAARIGGYKAATWTTTGSTRDGRLDFDVKVDDAFVNHLNIQNSTVSTGSGIWLSANGGLLETSITTVKTSTYTATTSDFLVQADTSGGGFTVNLPAGAVNGQILEIKKTTSDSNTLTVAGNGHNIDGSASLTLSTAYASVSLQYDSANTVWRSLFSPVTPAGSSTELQYRNGSAFGAASGITYNSDSNAILFSVASGIDSPALTFTNSVYGITESIYMHASGFMAFDDRSTFGGWGFLAGGSLYLAIDSGGITPSVDNTLTLGGGSTRGWVSVGARKFQAPNVSGSNVTGVDFVGDGGSGTGTAKGGSLNFRTYLSGPSSSSTSHQTNQVRIFAPAKAVTLTESTATSFFQLNCDTNKSVGGMITATVTAGDGTDTQTLTTLLLFDASNKAGTITMTVTPVCTNAVAETALGSTLTATFTAVPTSNSALLKCNAVSSLTQTTLQIRWVAPGINGNGSASVTTL